MTDREQLRYIGSYYNNGIIFKTKVYVINEQTQCVSSDLLKKLGINPDDKFMSSKL